MRALTPFFAFMAVAWVAGTSPAHAFHGAADFAKDALEGGGGGMYFTGSPRFRQYDCTICHRDAPREVRLSLDTDPSELVRDARYTPGRTYRLTVRLEGERRGREAMLNPNTFVLEALDENDAPVGMFAGLGPHVERPPGEQLVVARGEFAGVTEWSFEWDAPAQGTGPVTLYAAAVDGDGAQGRLGRTGDPLGDDVFVGRLRLQELGNEQPSKAGSAGCAVAGKDDYKWGNAVLIATALLLLAVRRVRRWRGMALSVVAIVALSTACNDPDVGIEECPRGVCGAPAETNADAGGPPLPVLDENFYRCRIQPIFDRTCAQTACHGVEEQPLRIYSRVKWRIDPAARGNSEAGKNALTSEEWSRNLSSARRFVSVDVAASELLTQPLRPAAGGLAHGGFTIFWTTDDPNYQTILEWIRGASLSTCDAGYND